MRQIMTSRQFVSLLSLIIAHTLAAAAMIASFPQRKVFFCILISSSLSFSAISGKLLLDVGLPFTYF